MSQDKIPDTLSDFSVQSVRAWRNETLAELDDDLGRIRSLMLQLEEHLWVEDSEYSPAVEFLKATAAKANGKPPQESPGPPRATQSRPETAVDAPAAPRPDRLAQLALDIQQRLRTQEARS